MKTFHLTLPRMGFIVGTRSLGAAGLGLLLGGRMRRASRRRLGAGLLALGLLSTIPALVMLARTGTDAPNPA